MINSLRTCLTCGKRFRIFQTKRIGEWLPPARSSEIHNMDKTGYFCKLRCAAQYGVSAAVAKLPVAKAIEENGNA